MKDIPSGRKHFK